MKTPILLKLKYKIFKPKLKIHKKEIDSSGLYWDFIPQLRSRGQKPIKHEIYCIDRYAMVRVGNEIKYFNIPKKYSLLNKTSFEIYKKYARCAFGNIHSLDMMLYGRDWYKEIKKVEINIEDLPDLIYEQFKPELDRLMVELL
jgi:hypothetical protein